MSSAQEGDTVFTSYGAVEEKKLEAESDIDKPDAITLPPLAASPINSLDDVNQEDSYHPSLNHKKAALLIKEGKDNEKFELLPENKRSWIAYRILHNPFYYWLALILAVALMLLAFLEEPSARSELDEKNKGKRIGHLVTELAILTFFAVQLLLRFLWLGPKLFFKGRSTVVAIVIIVMTLEIIVLFAKPTDRHVRIMRALRPFFLLDTYLMYGVRRVVRQIFQCLKYIIDVMLVLFFLVAVFALVGYFLFKNINPTYFRTLELSIVSMIVTLTTANHPDVFMEAYKKSDFAPIFFMIYMFVTFYYFSNVLLAVLFAKFKSAEKKKYKKLYLHKREALHRAFDLLKNDNDNIIFSDFLLFMKKYNPRTSPYQTMCLFKALQKCNGVEGCLSLEEFSSFYEYENMKWELIHKTGRIVAWYEILNETPKKLKRALKLLHFIVNHWLFDIVMALIVLANLLYLIIYIILYVDNNNAQNNTMNDNCTEKENKDYFCSARLGIAGSFIFNSIYLVEVNLKLFLNGPVKYFRKWANWVDYILVVGSFIFLCIEIGLIQNDADSPSFRYIAIIRPLKLLRLLRLKKNYFFLIRILIVLASRMTSVLILLMIVIYFFSIIGMEVFTGNNAVRAGCCANAEFNVGVYYDNSTLYDPGLYYLNNFNTLGRSFVTLYEEMVVNNWFIQMEGFVSTTGKAARLYFILFWMVTTLVVNIAIVYIVDAFVNALKASKMNEEISSGELKRVIKISLTRSEIRTLSNVIHLKAIYEVRKRFSIYRWIRKHYDIPARTIELYGGEFRGKRMMTDDDLRTIIYKGDIEEWKEKFDEERAMLVSKQKGDSIAIHKETPREHAKRMILMLAEKMKQLFFYLLG
ncbi:PREDICTED: two pore calcium channel protein 1-like [Amphimedon queenslandica]|uniref:Ion transport domain-containing protein n=1 Tax=Amphimedon queenslandica TaxID=400682 RepID=A0AAN0IZV0_AMPQE|nr:PREDICTED: two pore calcium channel protein 1-like [Amphimedon queenslandica]|eukprot:XP_019850067.1 PREDICTED: two pore calcium channel protein 1-like [Amphimedon queenslandica]